MWDRLNSRIAGVWKVVICYVHVQTFAVSGDTSGVFATQNEQTYETRTILPEHIVIHHNWRQQAVPALVKPYRSQAVCDFPRSAKTKVCNVNHAVCAWNITQRCSSPLARTPAECGRSLAAPGSTTWIDSLEKRYTR